MLSVQTNCAKMFVCAVKGGLGNQLFQILATIAHAMKNNHSFAFQLSGTKTGNRRLYWDDFLASLKPNLNLNWENFPVIL